MLQMIENQDLKKPPWDGNQDLSLRLGALFVPFQHCGANFGAGGPVTLPLACMSLVAIKVAWVRLNDMAILKEE